MQPTVLTVGSWCDHVLDNLSTQRNKTAEFSQSSINTLRKLCGLISLRLKKIFMNKISQLLQSLLHHADYTICS